MSHAKTRLVALVGPLNGERHVVQTTDHPLDPDRMLPMPDVVLLVSEDATSTMLFRYTAHGEFGGDTLHGSVREAQEQAADEYEDALMGWEPVPDDVGDAHLFAIRYAHDRLNDRGDWNGE
ncbi:MAG TPA: hypothetical protein VN706_25080 [Gemmatimonadaceae bacterium]|nr:hypothetical protein [Gemmatimonadaceae bacterium]